MQKLLPVDVTEACINDLVHLLGHLNLKVCYLVSCRDLDAFLQTLAKTIYLLCLFLEESRISWYFRIFEQAFLAREMMTTPKTLT